MLARSLVGGSIGFVGTLSYPLAVGLLLVYGFIVWLDSSSLTAGSAGTADPARRGATLAVHSTLGYAGGFVGPLMIGLMLDLAGGMSRAAWGAAFLAVAVLMPLALARSGGSGRANSRAIAAADGHFAGQVDRIMRWPPCALHAQPARPRAQHQRSSPRCRARRSGQASRRACRRSQALR